MRGGGRPLPISERAFFETRFGTDFGNVRVHTSPQAATSAQAVNARAFTLGRDIVFGAGEYAPEKLQGSGFWPMNWCMYYSKGRIGTTVSFASPLSGLPLKADSYHSAGCSRRKG